MEKISKCQNRTNNSHFQPAHNPIQADPSKWKDPVSDTTFATSSRPTRVATIASLSLASLLLVSVVSASSSTVAAFQPNLPHTFAPRPSPKKAYLVQTSLKPTLPSNLKMTGTDIDGKAIAQTIRTEIKDAVEKLKADSGKVPGLAVILVGERRDSQTYVRMKKKACEECGITSFGFDYPSDVTMETLSGKIAELNADPAVHGILVQLPLPEHIDEDNILNSIDPKKDVDGLHPLNTASLCSTSTHVGSTKIEWSDFTSIPFHIACTPQGCIELLDRSGVDLKGKNAVVIGRSNLVGLPVAMLLMHRNATVTIVHSKTNDVPGVVKNADIVVAAVGRAEMVKGDWIKEGAVVVDVGINSVDDPSAKRGYRLVGDVDYKAAKENASQITPVPGGVGPMTIAMLLRNTLNSCRRS